jgi:hypothetical protein
MDSGVGFPNRDGRRSSTATGRAVLADALARTDPALSAAIAAEKDWRHRYPRYFRELTSREATVPGGALRIAADGLDAVARRFVFTRDGRDRPLVEALRDGVDSARIPALHTATVTGRRAGEAPELVVPYRGARLTGDALRRQVDTWFADGIVEESFVEAVRAVQAHPEWLDLRGRTVVLLGAGAEMGPVGRLLDWGAHVVAVDLPRPALWRRLIAATRDGSGRLTVPVSRWLPASAGDDEIAEAAGADLVAGTPDLLGWLATVDPPYTVGNYAYAPGAAHLRVAVAADAVLAELFDRHGSGVSAAFLATPTDVFCVPEAAVQDSRRRHAGRGRARRSARAIARFGSAGSGFRPNYDTWLRLPDGRRAGLNDSLIVQQGPNYALAKRIQRWRAVHARAAGRTVSVQVAAASRTRSVLSNRLLAAGYAGAHRFGVEVFDPATSNALLAALLAGDLATGTSAADPGGNAGGAGAGASAGTGTSAGSAAGTGEGVPESGGAGHPLELFWSAANHGGLWRTPYAPRSVLGLAVLLGWARAGG